MFVVPRTADSHGIAPSKQEGRLLALTAAVAEPACDRQPQVLSKRVLLPPPGVHLLPGFRSPPGLSLPGKADAQSEVAGTGTERGFLAHRLHKLGLESSSSDCMTSIQEDVFLGPMPLKVRLSDAIDGSECSTTDCSTPMTIPSIPSPMDDFPQRKGNPPGRPSLTDMTEMFPPPPPPGLHLQLPVESGKQSSEAISIPIIGSPECPSIGSMGHKLGLCTPCDFVHRGTCRTGASCVYCHLCDPCTQKKCKKARRRFARAMRSLQEDASTSLGAL